MCHVQGGPLLELLQADDRFKKVWAVSRRPLEFDGDKATKIKLDLTEEEVVARALKELKIYEVTHILQVC